MRRRSAASVARAQFQPGLLGLLVNPFYFARKGLHEHLAALAPSVRGRVLDVGCGQKPYRHLFSAAEYVGLELDTPYNREFYPAEAYYDGERLPFPDGRFDSVVSFQVFEHVFEPDRFLSEIHRVLVDDGALLLCVPFVWDEHEQPRDYARYSSFALRHLLEKHGFRVERLCKSVDDVGVVFQLINCYLYKKTVTRSAYLNLLACLALMAPFNLAGQLVRFLLPRNADLYLDNVVLARKGKGGLSS